MQGHTHAHTDVTANRPDIIIKNKKYEPCILMDVAIPWLQKCHAKGSRKGIKYRSLCIEMK
jgi:hypothetical protein